MEEKTIRIEYGQTPNVLLLGNGINRAFQFASWDELIQSIQTKKLSEEEKNSLDDMPYPLRPVVLTEDHLGTKMKEISPSLTALQAEAAEEALLCSLAGLPFQAILTTNYTYELEKAIHKDFKCPVGRPCKLRHTAYEDAGKNTIRQLHTYFEGARDDQSVWHIHGEAARADTMVLGHYFYGKLLSFMQSYISVLQRRYHGNASRKQGMDCHSWIDLFMLGNVHIVGQGLDLSELDLWWLINCKRRHFPDTKVVFHRPDMRPEQKLLADAYHMELDTEGLQNQDYAAYYRQLINKLEKSL